MYIERTYCTHIRIRKHIRMGHMEEEWYIQGPVGQLLIVADTNTCGSIYSNQSHVKCGYTIHMIAYPVIINMPYAHTCKHYMKPIVGSSFLSTHDLELPYHILMLHNILLLLTWVNNCSNRVDNSLPMRIISNSLIPY